MSLVYPVCQQEGYTEQDVEQRSQQRERLQQQQQAEL